MIDAACYSIVRDPNRFDVICHSNQYRDIISGLASGLAGSLGLGAGANIGNEVTMVEACHGAAPDIAGKGFANPLALIQSAAILLERSRCHRVAMAVRDAIENAIKTRKELTPDLGGAGTTPSLTNEAANEAQRILM